MADRNMAIGTSARTEPGLLGIGDVIALDPPCAPTVTTVSRANSGQLVPTSHSGTSGNYEDTLGRSRHDCAPARSSDRAVSERVRVTRPGDRRCQGHGSHRSDRVVRPSRRRVAPRRPRHRSTHRPDAWTCSPVANITLRTPARPRTSVPRSAPARSGPSEHVAPLRAGPGACRRARPTGRRRTLGPPTASGASGRNAAGPCTVATRTDYSASRGRTCEHGAAPLPR
jgi:hypothetical protein